MRLGRIGLCRLSDWNDSTGGGTLCACDINEYWAFGAHVQ